MGDGGCGQDLLALSAVGQGPEIHSREFFWKLKADAELGVLCSGSPVTNKDWKGAFDYIGLEPMKLFAVVALALQLSFSRGPLGQTALSSSWMVTGSI